MAATRRGVRGRWRGRTLFGGGLLLLLGIAVIVIKRRSMGIEQNNQVHALEAELRSIASQRDMIVRALDDAKSRRRVVAEAERRLGLHVARDAQTRVLADSLRAP